MFHILSLLLLLLLLLLLSLLLLLLLLLEVHPENFASILFRNLLKRVALAGSLPSLLNRCCLVLPCVEEYLLEMEGRARTSAWPRVHVVQPSPAIKAVGYSWRALVWPCLASAREMNGAAKTGGANLPSQVSMGNTLPCSRGGDPVTGAARVGLTR